MTDRTSLGDRMKGYEQPTRLLLPRRTYTIVRVDGRAFHTYLRHAERPFDPAFLAAMNAVAQELCTDMGGAVLAYTQSDECSVLLTDFATTSTQPWFGGVVQKIASTAAAAATAAFNDHYPRPPGAGPATFDARVFTIPDPVEVANYLLWRQRDAVRNSITMTAQAHFSHRRLHGVTTDQMQELLWQEAGINWNDLPDGHKRGRVTVREINDADVTYTDPATGAPVTLHSTRSRWTTSAAPHFTATPDGWLAAVIPPLPRLTGETPG